MANNETILSRFVNEPVYRKKVIESIHKEQDFRYEKWIKVLTFERDELISCRQKEISRISMARWESVANDLLLINITEGKVQFNQSTFAFSDIKGAKLNIRFVNRVVTNEHGTSKKHTSLGGGVLGGLVLGAPGAVIGGVGLGKKQTNSTTTQTEIPMCTHIGVLVNVNEFVLEIIVLSEKVAESSSIFVKKQMMAQDIISKLAAVSKTPVPSTCLNVEDEPSVKEYDVKILDKEKEIQVAIDDKPTYKIPDVYRTIEQKDMSDEEYLIYLATNDVIRAEESVKLSQEKRERKKATIKKGFITISQKGLGMVKLVCGWLLSIFTLILVLATLIQGEIGSAIIFVVASLSINPLVYKTLKSKMDFLKKWMFVVLFILTFIIGMILFVSATIT